MLEALRRPLAMPSLTAGVVAAALLVALYCLAYTSLAGRPDTLIRCYTQTVEQVVTRVENVRGVVNELGVMPRYPDLATGLPSCLPAD